MTDYLAILLAEQLEEERKQEMTGAWDTGAVRVPLPQQKDPAEEKWEPLENKPFPQPAVQKVGTAAEAEKDDFQKNLPGNLAWTARRWAAGETEAVLAGLRTEKREKQTALSRQGDRALLPAAFSGARGKTDAGEPKEVAGSAGWLDRAVRVSLAELPQPEQQPRVVTLEPGTADQSARRLELRQLDRLVRRDARRFDGGFQLL